MGSACSCFNANNATEDNQTVQNSSINETIATGTTHQMDNAPLAIDVASNESTTTPRKTINDEYLQSVPFTPNENERQWFKYYCPICMNHFKIILKSDCCGHYICVKCCLEFLSSKGLLADSIHDVIGCSYLSSISCPNCASDASFCPKFVSSEEIIRDYGTSVGTSSTVEEIFSPLKVGASFEDLKRKMKQYKTDCSPCKENDSTSSDKINNSCFSKEVDEDGCSQSIASPSRLFMEDDLEFSSHDVEVPSKLDPKTLHMIAQDFVNGVINNSKYQFSHQFHCEVELFVKDVLQHCLSKHAYCH